MFKFRISTDDPTRPYFVIEAKSIRDAYRKAALEPKVLTYHVTSIDWEW